MHSLTCINNSQQLGSFVMFQSAPPSSVPPNAFVLAWFVRPVHPGTQATFTWSLDYDFVWSETGILVPGITFAASQVLAADPNGSNLVQLTVDSYGATYFTAPTATGAPGSLTVEQLATIVPDRTAVGIGMSGAATFVIQAAPNIRTIFTPRPNYWVAFGNFQQGQVIDGREIADAQEVSYPAPLTARTAILGADGRITIS